MYFLLPVQTILVLTLISAFRALQKLFNCGLDKNEIGMYNFSECHFHSAVFNLHTKNQISDLQK